MTKNLKITTKNNTEKEITTAGQIEKISQKYKIPLFTDKVIAEEG